jgi:hypothetical protein
MKKVLLVAWAIGVDSVVCLAPVVHRHVREDVAAGFHARQPVADGPHPVDRHRRGIGHASSAESCGGRRPSLFAIIHVVRDAGVLFVYGEDPRFRVVRKAPGGMIGNGSLINAEEQETFQNNHEFTENARAFASSDFRRPIWAAIIVRETAYIPRLTADGTFSPADFQCVNTNSPGMSSEVRLVSGTIMMSTDGWGEPMTTAGRT